MLLVSTVALGVLLTNSLIDDYHPSRATSAAGVSAAAAAADGAAPGSFRDTAASVHTYLVTITEVTKKPLFIQCLCSHRWSTNADDQQMDQNQC